MNRSSTSHSFFFYFNIHRPKHKLWNLLFIFEIALYRSLRLNLITVDEWMFHISRSTSSGVSFFDRIVRIEAYVLCNTVMEVVTLLPILWFVKDYYYFLTNNCFVQSQWVFFWLMICIYICIAKCTSNNCSKGNESIIHALCLNFYDFIIPNLLYSSNVRTYRWECSKLKWAEGRK